MGNIISDMAELPARIQARVREAEADVGAFLFAFKTAFKPNATIPFIWLVLADRGILLCITHRSRGNWALMKRSDVDRIVVEQRLIGPGLIRISPKQLQADGHVLPLNEALEQDKVEQVLSDWKRM